MCAINFKLVVVALNGRGGRGGGGCDAMMMMMRWFV